MEPVPNLPELKEIREFRKSGNSIRRRGGETDAQEEVPGEVQEVRGEKPCMKSWRMSARVINIFFVVSCIYVLFLIYGVSVTQYQYHDDGSVSAQRLSVDGIREKKEYEKIMAQYERCRLLYEKVLMLDYRLGAGQEDPLVLALKYESLLDDVTDLSVKTDALAVDMQYSQIKGMMASWIKDDIAVYLQNMSSAISQDSKEAADHAIQDKDRVYDKFLLITQSMAATGKKIHGAEISGIKGWTPERYIDGAIHSKD